MLLLVTRPTTFRALFADFVTSRSLLGNHETSLSFAYSEENVHVLFVSFLREVLSQSCNDFHDFRSLQVIM